MNRSYPIGEFNYQKPSAQALEQAIQEIADFPNELESYLHSAKPKWEQTYRPGSWTAEQVLHHIVDSHINAYCRIKLCLAEPGSSLRPYEEKEWTKLNSFGEEEIQATLFILRGLHHKMASLLNACKLADFQLSIYHPEQQIDVNLGWLCMAYAWHGKHHLAHIKLAFGDL